MVASRSIDRADTPRQPDKFVDLRYLRRRRPRMQGGKGGIVQEEGTSAPNVPYL